METITSEDLQRLTECIEGLNKDFIRIQNTGGSCLRFSFRHRLGCAAEVQDTYRVIFHDLLNKPVEDHGQHLIVEAKAMEREWCFTVHSLSLINMKNSGNQELQEDAARLMKELDMLNRRYQLGER